MAESISVRVPNLNDSNYAEWSVRMEAILIRRGLWSLVKINISEITADGVAKSASKIAEEYRDLKKKRDVEKMDEARAEMILRVEDGQLSHMRSRDPLEIWETLERVHRASGFATSLALRRKFLTAKKEETQSMQAWIGFIQSLAFRMEQAGVSVSDQDRILALTMGLPSSYDAVIINFDATEPNSLTLNHVITRLLNEETRQIAIAPNSSIPAYDEAMIAFGTGKGRGSKGTRVNPDVVCYFCEKKGHYRSECPERLAWEKSKGEKSRQAMAAWESSDSESEDAF
jgi:hypothetical protein